MTMMTLKMKENNLADGNRDVNRLFKNEEGIYVYSSHVFYTRFCAIYCASIAIAISHSVWFFVQNWFFVEVHYTDGCLLYKRNIFSPLNALGAILCIFAVNRVAAHGAAMYSWNAVGSPCVFGLRMLAYLAAHSLPPTLSRIFFATCLFLHLI